MSNHRRMTMNERCDEVFNRRSAPMGLCDSDRNIMASMRHEACESHCEDCGDCLGPYAHQVGLEQFEEEPIVTIGDHDYCEWCAHSAERQT